MQFKDQRLLKKDPPSQILEYVVGIPFVRIEEYLKRGIKQVHAQAFEKHRFSSQLSNTYAHNNRINEL